jgi:hypothetical protein
MLTCFVLYLKNSELVKHLFAFGKTITKVEYVQYGIDMYSLPSEMFNAQNDRSCFVVIM